MCAQTAEKHSRDIRLNFAPEVEWIPGQTGSSLEQMAKHSLDQATAAIDWYLARKTAKRLGARLLRSSAILLILAAGLVPLVGEIWAIDGRPGVSPLWASVAVVLAAGAVGIDRFFGFSAAYMRYLTASMKLQRMAQNFGFEWQARRAAFASEGPTPAQVQETLDACKRFSADIAQAVEVETDSWVQDFTNALAEIDKSTRVQSETARAGAINLTVTNADKSESGWQLMIDDGSPAQRAGKTAAVRGLVPGTHIVRATGQIEGVTRNAERNVVTAAGSVVELELTLE